MAHVELSSSESQDAEHTLVPLSFFFHGVWHNSTISGLLRHFPDSFNLSSRITPSKENSIKTCIHAKTGPHTLEFRS